MRLAVRNATRADLAKLRRQLKEEHAVMHSYAQTHWARLASSFHMRVAELSRNATLQRYLAELVSRCSLIVALHEPAGYAACEHDEHTHIVDLIERGDARAQWRPWKPSGLAGGTYPPGQRKERQQPGADAGDGISLRMGQG
jgi:DNA-binding GntR family transcriptional regulator